MPPLQSQIYACGETRGEIVTSGEQNSTVRKTLFGYEKQDSTNPSNCGAGYPLRDYDLSFSTIPV
jgi:hypothetical protein